MGTNDPKKPEDEKKKTKEEVEEHEWKDDDYKPRVKRKPVVYQAQQQSAQPHQTFTYASPETIQQLIRDYKRLQEDLGAARGILLKKVSENQKKHALFHSPSRVPGEQEKKFMHDREKKLEHFFPRDLLMKEIKSLKTKSELELATALKIKRAVKSETKILEKKNDSKALKEIENEILKIIEDNIPMRDSLLDSAERFWKRVLSEKSKNAKIDYAGIRMKVNETERENMYDDLYGKLNVLLKKYALGKNNFGVTLSDVQLKSLQKYAYEKIAESVYGDTPSFRSSPLLETQQKRTHFIPDGINRALENGFKKMKEAKSFKELSSIEHELTRHIKGELKEMELSPGEIRDWKAFLESKIDVIFLSKKVALIEQEMETIKSKFEKEYENDPESVKKLMDSFLPEKQKTQKPPRLRS